MPHGQQEVRAFLLEVGFEAVGSYFTDGQTNAFIKDTQV
jgi:hypothetical protein